MSFLPKLLYSQWCVTPEYPTQSFECQVAIVTGANTGLGLESARHLVRLGAEKVVLACRSEYKGEAAKVDIEKTTGRQGVVEVWKLDLSSYQSIKDFAKRAESLARIDCLLENAGIMKKEFEIVENNESMITTNVISTFLLGFLLLPKLKQSAQKFGTRPRITIVSSELGFTTDLPERKNPGKIFDTLNDEKTARMGDRYNISKLLEMFAVRGFVDEYASPAASYPVTINYLSPGFCRSELGRESGFELAVANAVLHARTTEVGSRVLVYAAGGGIETHGQYLANDKVTPCGSFLGSSEGIKTQKRVWAELKEKLEKIEPGLFARV